MPYQTTADLPANVKKLPAKKRRQWMHVWNSVFEDTGNEERAFKAAWAAVKREEGNKEMSTTRFEALAPFFKAYEKDGQRRVSLLASTGVVDRQDERVTPEFMEHMRKQTAEGEVELVETHSSAFAIGKSVGYVPGDKVWDEIKDRITAKSPEEVFIPEFALEEDHPLADRLFKAVESNNCKWQASIGGTKVQGRKVFDKSVGRVIKELTDGELDHVALTRKGRSVNPETCFLGAVAKAVDWDEIEDPPEATEKDEAGEAVQKTEDTSQVEDGDTTVDKDGAEDTPIMSEEEKAARDRLIKSWEGLNETEKARRGDVMEALNAALRPTALDAKESYSYVQEIDTPETGTCILNRNGNHYRAKYQVSKEGTATFSDEEEVRREWVAMEKAEDETVVTLPSEEERRQQIAEEAVKEEGTEEEPAPIEKAETEEPDGSSLAGLMEKVQALERQSVEAGQELRKEIDSLRADKAALEERLAKVEALPDDSRTPMRTTPAEKEFAVNPTDISKLGAEELAKALAREGLVDEARSLYGRAVIGQGLLGKPKQNAFDK